MTLLNLIRAGDLRDRNDRLRMFSLFGNCVAIVPLSIMVVYQAYQGVSLVLGLTCLLWCLVSVNIYLLSKRFSFWLTRFACLVFVATVITSLFLYDARPALVWCMVLPPLFILVFGPREGMLWTFAVYLPSVVFAVANEAQIVFQKANVAVGITIICILSTFFAIVFQAIFRRSQTQMFEGGARLEREERRFRDFSRLASDWLFEIDKDFKFTYVSENFLNLMPGAQSVDETNVVPGLAELIAAACIQGAEELIEATVARKALHNHRMVFEFFGNKHTVRLKAQPIYENGEFVGYRGVAADLTELEEADAQFRKQERMLYHAQKMEAVGQLSSGIAHDFNNLLTVIRGNLELLELDLPSIGQNAQLEEAKRASESASQLTANMLAFARRQPLRPRPTDARVLLEGMQPILRQTLSEAISIHLTTSPELWLCLVDPAQLESALLNLAINARDAMPHGGSFEIKLENDTIAQHQELAPGDYVKITLIDSGVGIEESIQELVFDPFFSTKPQGVGSGLGLSMVYGFIRQSNGSIALASVIGQGTTLTLWLPRGVEEPHGDALDRTGVRAPEKLCILVVEDDEGVRALISAMLKILGHHGLIFASSEEALVQAESEDIDMLITDVVLANGESGLELAKLMRRRSQQLPILFISGYAEPLSNADFQLDERMSLLSKPFGVSDLTDAIVSLQGG